MKKSISLFCKISILVVFSACNPPAGHPVSEKKYIDPANIDSSVKPGDNFFLYVNGKWIKDAVIPATQTSVGGFTDLYINTQGVLHGILDSLSKGKHEPGTIEQKVGDFYTSGMDSITIDKLGYEPLKPYLSDISGIQQASGVMKYAAKMQAENQNFLYIIGIGSDDKNSNQNILQFVQGGLGLPDRDYYFRKDPSSLGVINAYQHYIKTLFQLTGDDSVFASKKMQMVYELEKQMAESHKTNVETRDPQSNYHKMSVASLDKQMPAFAWSNTLDAMGIRVDSVILRQPAFYQRLNELLKTTPLDTWKAYLQFHTIDGHIALLSSSFSNASFDFYSKALYGQQKMKPRWNRIVGATDTYLGEGLGQIYVEQYFSKDAKARMMELVNNLQIAFENRIGQLDWMSDSTKLKAKEKLHTFIKKIGYPDKWRDYSRVSIDKKTYFENVVSCQKSEYNRAVAKLGKPVDRLEWGMTPPTIDAYYNASFNEIVFPAGILQSPFFDPAADDAVNYGAIGMVIGHEMTHGFDDEGAQYDKDGNLKNWWSKSDSIKFTDKTKEVILQYNGFIAIDTFHVNGALTTGENIADLGGLTIAYDAFKLTKQGQDTVRIDGLLPDERFFMSFATIWRGKQKEELRRQMVNIDPHSPAQFRVNGPLQNFSPFYTTFKIQSSDKMYKPEAERIKIW